MYKSDRLLRAGAVIGGVGVILLLMKVGAFWLGGLIMAAGCALIGTHYWLGAAQAPMISGWRHRRPIFVAITTVVVLFGVGAVWLSALSVAGHKVGPTEATIGNGLFGIGVLFGVLVLIEMLMDREE